eukprot:5090525-Pleurochrysis_carterae.AAC.1
MDYIVYILSQLPKCGLPTRNMQHASIRLPSSHVDLLKVSSMSLVASWIFLEEQDSIGLTEKLALNGPMYDTEDRWWPRVVVSVPFYFELERGH